MVVVDGLDVLWGLIFVARVGFVSVFLLGEDCLLPLVVVVFPTLVRLLGLGLS